MNISQGFYNLTPHEVLNAVEAQGFKTTGEYLQLNSYENRVFDIFLEPDLNPPELNNRIIAKFYRPLRWSREAIVDEHTFTRELQDEGLPAITTYGPHSVCVSEHHGLYLSLFPKVFGRMPQELNFQQLKSIGRSLAHLHNIGERQVASHRPDLDTETFGYPSLDILENWVAPEVWRRYQEAALIILDFLEAHLDHNDFIRIHGDCHKGNLLMTDTAGENSQFFFVDFDDFCNGPVAQDFWMLFSGDNNDAERQAILSGYQDLRRFSKDQFALMEPLRGLRIIRYAAWIAQRWEDPSFPKIFPNFEQYSYWAEETENLEQIAWAL